MAFLAGPSEQQPFLAPCLAGPRYCHSSGSARAASIRSLSSSPIYRSSPPGRSWPYGDAMFQVFLDVFQTCCKPMFQVFQVFQMYISIVSCGCCKSRSGCCICCNGYTHMLQTSISNVSSVFLHICCKCFRRMSKMFYLSSFVYCRCCI
jgi:hypothetical protein